MKKLTVVFAALALMLGFASTASAQHHGNGNFNHGNGNFNHGNGNFNHGNHGGEGNHGGYRGGYDGYRGGFDGYRGYDGYRRGGVEIIIGGRRGYPYPYPNGGWNNGGYYPDTRIVYERVYDEFGRSYTVSHVARWDSYYRGYVWYDQNGNLRVN